MKRIVFLAFLLICSMGVSAQDAHAVDSIKFENAKKEISIFVNAADCAGIDLFKSDQPVTILAPDNAAFEKLPTGKLDSLLKPANKQALINLLQQHIIPDKLSAKDLGKLIHLNNGQTTLTTLSGNKLIVKINLNQNLILVDANGNESIIKRFNLQQSNVTLFVISAVITPAK